MKNIRFALILTCFTGAAAGQGSAADTIKPDSYSDSCARKMLDSTRYISDLVIYIDPGGGYVCGNSYLNMKTKAQKFFINGGDTITHVAFLFGRKSVDANPGNIRAKIYSADGSNGSPGSLLGESLSLSTSLVKASQFDIDSASKLTVVAFLQPQPVPDSFFIGLDLTQLAPGDSVGLFSTKDSCYSGMQLAWEEDSNGAWHPFNDGTGASYRLNIDMAIFAIKSFNVGINDAGTQGGGVEVFPNPASDEIYFHLNAKNESKTDIHIYDACGKIIKSNDRLNSQNHIFTFETSDLSKGIYFYSVKAGDNFTTGKFLINR